MEDSSESTYKAVVNPDTMSAAKEAARDMDPDVEVTGTLGFGLRYVTNNALLTLG